MAKALIVDNYQMLRQTIGEIIVAYGLEVEHTATGEEALKLIKEKDYDIALVEARLPGELSGIELARKVGGWRTRVIGMSCYPADEIGFTMAGVGYFIVKPFKEKQLFAAIKLSLTQKLVRPHRFAKRDAA